VGFVGLYTVFIIAEMYLLLRAIRKGPEQPHDDGADWDSGPMLADSTNGGHLASHVEG
jgi:cytochrome bd-type quinol oxidase subunit 1